MDKNIELKVRDLVWAKAKGNPWWPGIIKNISLYNIPKDSIFIKEKIYTIYFIGEKSYVKLTKEHIELFSQNYQDHLSTKNPSLMKSIKLAKKLYDKRNSKKINKLKENFKDLGINENKNNDIIHKEKNEKNFYQKDNDYNYDNETISNNFLQNKRKKKRRSISSINKNKEYQKFIEPNKDDSNIKINININLTNNNNNTFNIFGCPQLDQFTNNDMCNNINKESINLNVNKNLETKNINKDEFNSYVPKDYIFKNYEIKQKNRNENIIDDIQEENIYNHERQLDIKKEKDNENDIFMKKDNIKKLIKKLVSYQLESPYSLNQEVILDELDNFYIALKDYLLKEEKISDIYSLNKDFLSILETFTFNIYKSEIKERALNILSLFTQYIIKEVFSFNDLEKKLLKDDKLKIVNKNIDNNKNIDKDFDIESNSISEICELIDQNTLKKNSLVFKKSKSKKMNTSPEKYVNNELNIKSQDIYDNLIDKNCELIIDEFMKIIEDINEEKEKEFNKISENFYKNIYNKKNNELDFISSIKRKKLCIKMLHIIRKINPNNNEDFIKNIIIYYEYKMRSEDPTLGYKYHNIINILFNKIKGII